VFWLLAYPVAAAPPAADLRCGVDILLRADMGKIPPDGLQLARISPLDKRQATIVLNAGPGLAANAEALAAWDRAVAAWERWLRDPVTIVINGDLESLPPGVLGASTARLFANLYGTLRSAMIADAEDDEDIVAGLPTPAQLNLLLPPGFTYPGQAVATKANLKALGFDMSFDNAQPDAEIVFSTNALGRFDFDASDGIDPDKLDFEAVVVHEIGHALGFASAVDQADIMRDQGQTGALYPYALDLFRLLPNLGAVDFTGAERLLTTGDLAAMHVTHDGTDDLAMSTGANLGDGNQASHWKDDVLSGSFIGIMDPTLSNGQREELTGVDLRAFGLIGWDMADPMRVHRPDDEISDPLSPPVHPFAITQVYPNPFNPATTIEFSLAEISRVRLMIVDVRGSLVRSLLDGYLAPGPHHVHWHGLDDAGARVGSGIYILRLESSAGILSEKLVLLQ
jgi:hypothetical protein